MPTAAERQALVFLISVALLGGGVRAYESHRRTTLANATEISDNGSEGVGSQLAAVDSARHASRSSSRALSPRSPRSDTRSAKRSTPRRPNGSSRNSKATAPDDSPPVAIDVDVASAEELERLPRVGAALAQRIVANRDSLGGFGSVEALTRVRGIGPAMARQLAPLVTFSSGPSPFHAEPRKRPR